MNIFLLKNCSAQNVLLWSLDPLLFFFFLSFFSSFLSFFFLSFPCLLCLCLYWVCRSDLGVCSLRPEKHYKRILTYNGICSPWGDLVRLTGRDNPVTNFSHRSSSSSSFPAILVSLLITCLYWLDPTLQKRRGRHRRCYCCTSLRRWQNLVMGKPSRYWRGR